MAQRISRAKQRIKAAGATFRLPPEAERTDRLRVVLHVLYLMFNEGYTATSGPNLVRAELTAEAIRLTRVVLRLVPDDGEVAGLLALMLLTEARRPARTAPDGALVPLAEQDRTLWDADAIAEGVALVTGSLATKPLGPYQVQAAIAAVHDEAAAGRGHRLAPDPRPLRVARAGGAEPDGHAQPGRGTRHGARAPEPVSICVDTLSADDRVGASHHFDSVRAHLLEMAGDHRAARAAYRLAARRTTSLPERQHLLARAARLR